MLTCFQETTVAGKEMLVRIYMFTTVRKDESREATSNRCISRCPLHACWNIAARIVSLTQVLCTGTSGIINEYKICDVYDYIDIGVATLRSLQHYSRVTSALQSSSLRERPPLKFNCTSIDDAFRHC